MSSMPWQRREGTPLGYSAGSQALYSTEHGQTDATPSSARPTTPWGPEVWPAEVRENVTTWPPTFRERQLISAIATPRQRRCIAVVAGKSGLGRSTTARILHTIFAVHRGEGSILIDANGAPGDAACRLLTTPIGAAEAAAVPGMELVGRTVNNDSPLSGVGSYGDLLDELRRVHDVLVCDVGNIGVASLHDILARVDQVVIMAAPTVDRVYAASSYLDWLQDSGYQQLAADAVVALNQIRPMPFTNLLNIDRHFARRCRRVIRIPWDSRVGADRSVGLDELRPTTRTGFFELASAIVRGATESSAASREETR